MASLTFEPPIQSFAEVETTIVLDGTGGTTGAGFDSLTGTTTVVPGTPEPASLLLGIGGLLVIGSLRRRRTV